MRSWKWGLHDGVSILVSWGREDRESLLLNMPWHGDKMALCKPGRELDQELNLPALWPWTSLLSELWGINTYCVNHPIYGMLLQQVGLTKTQEITYFVMSGKLKESTVKWNCRNVRKLVMVHFCSNFWFHLCQLFLQWCPAHMPSFHTKVSLTHFGATL